MWIFVNIPFLLIFADSSIDVARELKQSSAGEITLNKVFSQVKARMIKVPIRASSSCVKPPGDNPVRALQTRGGCPAGVCSTVGVVNYFECYYTFLTINSCSGPAPCDDAPQRRVNECAGEEVQISWQVVRSSGWSLSVQVHKHKQRPLSLVSVE